MESVKELLLLPEEHMFLYVHHVHRFFFIKKSTTSNCLLSRHGTMSLS